MQFASSSRALAALALLAALPAAALAQQTIIDRAQQGGPAPVPAPVAVEPAAAPGADTDAGTQRIAEPRRLPLRLTASAGTQLYATDNVFLADGSKDGALVSSTNLAVGLESLPVVVGEGRLVFSAAFIYERNLHDLGTSDQVIEALDFDSYSLPLAASFGWGKGWEAAATLTLGSLYSIGEADGGPSHELLYRSTVPALSLRKLTELSQGLVLSAGASISYLDTQASLHDIDPLIAYRKNRNDQIAGAFDVSLYRLVGAWTFAPSVRVSYGHYLDWQEGGFVDHDRDDLTVGLSFTAAYAFSTWGTVRAFAGADFRRSDTSAPAPISYDYDAASGGFGISLTARF